MRPKFIFYDFDGVLTDNRALLSESGQEYVFVNRSDGLAIGLIKSLLNIPQAIISTEKSNLSSARGEKLGIPVFNGVADKLETCKSICIDSGCSMTDAVFVGNDLNDIDVMKAVGWPLAPLDAHPEILELARVRLNVNGGYGVVREIYSIIREGGLNVD
jgi:YrbI family 3-deoxy-D-manno-octulosonate 8-phosphate phosphatase